MCRLSQADFSSVVLAHRESAGVSNNRVLLCPGETLSPKLAKEQFGKRDRVVQERFARKPGTVAVNPARYRTRLSSVEAFKIRIGDYRAIVDVDWQQRIVYILSVGHRSTGYR